MFGRASFQNTTTVIGRTLGIQATRNEVITSRDHQPTLIMALEFMNVEELDTLIKKSPAAAYFVRELNNRPLSKLLDELYMVVYNRKPTPEETTLGKDFFKTLLKSPYAKSGLRQKLFIDLYWALLSGSEFIYIQ